MDFNNSNKRSLDFSSLFEPNKATGQSTSEMNVFRSGPDMSGWVVRPRHHDMMDFAIGNLPSTWSPHRVAWVCLRNYENKTQQNSEDSGGLYSGKWMWFVHENALDEKFLLLANALQNNLLGDSIKVQPTDCNQFVYQAGTDNGTLSQRSLVPFIVYTKDFRDREDVLRVGLALRKLGANLISYKPDVFTTSEEGIHGSNQIPKSIYSLPKDKTELNLMDKGESYDIAMRMISGGGNANDVGVINVGGGGTGGGSGKTSNSRLNKSHTVDTSIINSNSGSSSSGSGAFRGTGHTLGGGGGSSSGCNTSNLAQSRLVSPGSTSTSSSSVTPSSKRSTTAAVTSITPSVKAKMQKTSTSPSKQQQQQQQILDLTDSLPSADNDFWDDVV